VVKNSDAPHGKAVSKEALERGLRIKAAREAHGLTQQGLAELLVSLGASATTSKTTVWKWENGEVEDIANTTLYFLVKALHTSHQHIIFGPKGEPKAPAQLRKKDRA